MFADNATSMTDTASVTVIGRVLGGNIDLLQSKRAFNQTRGVDATTVTAQSGDIIVYTLSVENRGNQAATNFVVEDDIRDILELAELTSFGDATFNLGLYKLSWPAVTVPAGSKVDKVFTVRVRSAFPSASDFVMTNFYGNRVDVRVPRVGGEFIAPKTGATLALSLLFASLTVASYALRKEKFRFKLRNHAQ